MARPAAGGRVREGRRVRPAAPERYELILQNPNHYPDVELRSLRSWLLAALPSVLAGSDCSGTSSRSLGVRFASDRELHRANRSFRGKDAPTDVLSFPGEEGPEGWYLGDILISVPTARRQALARGWDAQRELRTLVLHGLLHCLGYDHERDQGEMDRLERRLRRVWIAPGRGND
jgi:probable rRNA maturation factor